MSITLSIKYSLTEVNDTPLHYAIFHGNADVVRYLLERGADRDQYNLVIPFNSDSELQGCLLNMAHKKSKI